MRVAAEVIEAVPDAHSGLPVVCLVSSAYWNVENVSLG